MKWFICFWFVIIQHMSKLWYILPALLLLFNTHSQVPQRPVIGILTQDAQQFSSLTQNQNNGFSTYIASSYVKNLQMAGALVIPLFYHYSYTQLSDILGKINGVFFPGGEMPITYTEDWTNKTAYIYNYAKQQNNNGNVYPIWATCLGYEALMYITSNQTDNSTVLTQVFGEDGLTRPLIIKNYSSQLLQTLVKDGSSDQATAAISGDGIFYFHHRWAVLLSTFQSNEHLKNTWSLITTSKTKDNVEFVSTLEAKSYPFYLTQYHPQKNSFEWRIPAARSSLAVRAAQNYINLFVTKARQNKNTFPTDELAKKLIYNYHPVLTPLDYAFVQVYLFDQSKI